MYNLMMQSTYFVLCLYGIKLMVKDHSDSERGNPSPPLQGLFFLVSSSLCYTRCGELAGMRSSSVDPP